MIQFCFDCCHKMENGFTGSKNFEKRRRKIKNSTNFNLNSNPNLLRTNSHFRGLNLNLNRNFSIMLLFVCFLFGSISVSSAQQISSQASTTDASGQVGVTTSVGNIAADGVEYFQSQPQVAPYFVRSGEPGPTLPCSATPKYAQDPQYRLIWVKVIQNGSPRIISQGAENYNADKYDLDAGQTCHGCYNLRMRNVTFADDNGRFFCQLQGPNSFLRESNAAQVVVLVKPSAPQISGQTSAPLREGQTAQLDCQSLGGNPPPRITWKFGNNTDATGFARIRNGSDLQSPTVSTLQWPVSYRENNQFLKCFVWNEAMGDAVAPMEISSARFTVQYSPKVVAGPANPYSVEDQKEATLTCTADANPPPRGYVWSYLAPESSAPSTLPASNVQNLTVQANRHDRGIYTCSASNELGNGQDSIQLDVQYEPKINFITGNNQSSQSMVLVSENQAVSVTCQPDANPPASSVTWTGPNGQQVSDNAVLNLHAVSRNEAGNYTCTASNTLTLYGGGSMPRQGSGVLEIKVKHAPGRAVISESEPAVVGGTVNLSCIADDVGAPAALYRWKAPGQSEFELVARQVYTIENVQLDKAGEYACLPYNEVGNGQATSYRLIIYQPAQMEDHLKPEDQKKEADAYELTCSARGHPAPNITWYKDDELIALSASSDHWTSTSKIESSTGDCSDPSSTSSPASDQCSYKVVGTLKWIDGIRWTDKGYISCRAYNGAGRPTESKTLLKIQHKPVIVNDPNRPFVAAELGQQAIIECKASSNPEPLFRWTRGGQQGDLTASDSAASTTAGLQQYSMNQAKINQSYDLYEHTLVIKQVGEDDFGDYQCKANNNLGEDSFVFKLQRKTKPLQPEEFQGSKEKSHRWLILSWIPGFDGGYEQSFTIEQIERGLTYNVTEAEATSASTIAQSLRFRRHVGIEKPTRAQYNMTNLAPASTYSFRIKAWNRLGETEWSDKIAIMTDDAPLDSDIKKPDQPVYNADTGVLEVRPTLDPGKYCLLIYLRSPSGAWETWNCVDPDSNVQGVPRAGNMRVRFCNRYTMNCGEPTEVMTGVGAGFPPPIIVAIVVAAVVLLALACVIFFCCLRSRRQKQSQANGRTMNGNTNTAEKNKENQKKHKKTASTSNGTSSRNGTAKKDYEMETNQARPKVVSGPYLTKNTPGPNIGLGVDQNTGSSKDSGVFTTSSATNFPYDQSTARNGGNPYVSDSAIHHHPHHHGQNQTGNGNGPTMLNRPPSYDGHEHWGATDGYGLATNGGGAYLNGANGHAHHHHGHHPQHSMGPRGGHDFHDGAPMEALNGNVVNAGPNGSYYDANTPTSAGPSGFVDPYAGGGGFVDMNPNGSGGGNGSGNGGDGSLNSGYSTPTQRRLMREIIV